MSKSSATWCNTWYTGQRLYSAIWYNWEAKSCVYSQNSIKSISFHILSTSWHKCTLLERLVLLVFVVEYKNLRYTAIINFWAQLSYSEVSMDWLRGQRRHTVYEPAVHQINSYRCFAVPTRTRFSPRLEHGELILDFYHKQLFVLPHIQRYWLYFEERLQFETSV